MTGLIRDQIRVLQVEFESRPEGLRRHVERVLVEALDLARRYDLDTERVELAVRGHDLFRATPPDEMLVLAQEVGLAATEDDRRDPVLMHGPVAAIVLRERFGVGDEDALAAVRDHTLGLATMPIIARVILIADKVESRKRERTPAMRAIRRVARHDLDMALLCWADWKWVEERTNGWNSHPQHWAARIAWVHEHHADVAVAPLEFGDP